MAAIKKNDFVEIEYTGTIKGENAVFDTTFEEVAKKHGFERPSSSFGPLVACVGEHFLLKGLDDFLIGKDVGKDYAVDLSPVQGFGKKDPKLLQMIPSSKFRQSNVLPYPGLQINVDGTMGTVKTVSGGRIMVDFNHPLSGKDLSYSFKVLSVVTDEKRKVEAYLRHLGLEEMKATTENGIVTIAMHTRIDEAIEQEFSKKIKALIPSITEVRFVAEKESTQKEETHANDHSHHGHSH